MSAILLGLVIGGFITIIGIWFKTRSTVNDIRQHRNECETWLSNGASFESYRSKNHAIFKNNRASCHHCGSEKMSMVHRYTACPRVEYSFFHLNYIWYPNEEYRSHICSQCGQELWRSKNATA